MAMSRGQMLVSLALEKRNKEHDKNSIDMNAAQLTDIAENVLKPKRLLDKGTETSGNVTNTPGVHEQEKLLVGENVNNNDTNPNKELLEDLDEELIEGQLDEFYDLDDSIAYPDFVAANEDVCSSEHESEDINTPEMFVDHEEEVADLNQTENEDTSGTSEVKFWVKNQNKRRRMQGKSYKGMKKENGKCGFTVQINERVPSERHCLKRCYNSTVKHCLKITEDDRKSIFTMFWANTTLEERKVYVNSLVATTETSAKTVGDSSRRNQSYKYFLRKDCERICVCKNLFLSTLGIGEKTVYGWVEAANHGIPANQSEQETQSERKRVQAKRQGELRENVQTFLESLPKLESHYCRASSSKLYLEPVFESMKSLYKEYKNVTNTGKTASRKLFNEVLLAMNLSLFSPKKDKCDLCCSYEVGNVSADLYNKHQERKSDARAEKDRDKACAMETNSVKVITMNVQSVLLSPKLQASALYYKTKLACHNFTVYDLASKDVSCYFWHEEQGDLTGNSFATCIVHYIETVVGNNSDVKHFILYSDGCGYQNRNAVLANVLCHLSSRLGITITQKYLEKGHTQMEVDSVRSSIERKIKKRNIYVPQNFVEAIVECRPDQPYLIHYLDHTFFKKFIDLSYYNSIRPGTNVWDPVVSDFGVITYTPDGNVQCKLSYTDELMDLPRRARNTDPNTTQPKQLHDEPIKIKKSKSFASIQSCVAC